MKHYETLQQLVTIDISHVLLIRLVKTSTETRCSYCSTTAGATIPVAEATPCGVPVTSEVEVYFTGWWLSFYPSEK